MAEQDILTWCPVWQSPCIKSGCTSYEVHTKQRFKNMKSGRYIPLDQIIFYKDMSQEQLNETVERSIMIVHECKYFAKIIEIENKTDHLIPFEQ